MLNVTIDRRLDEPVYAQVARQVREYIASGALSPGTQLPSVRALAGDLGVNLNTVARAYRLLETEGFLSIRGRSGVTVASPSRKLGEPAGKELRSELRIVLAKLHQGGLRGKDLRALLDEEVAVLERRKKEDSRG